MADTNTRNIAYAGIGVFAAGIIAYMAIAAGLEEADHSEEEVEEEELRVSKYSQGGTVGGADEEEEKKDEGDANDPGEKYTEEKLLEFLEVLDAELTAGYVRNYWKMKTAAKKDKDSNGKIRHDERNNLERETVFLIQKHTQDLIS